MTDTIFEDGFSEEIWAQTYCDSKDGDIDGTMRRVSGGAAEAEETDELKSLWSNKFYDMLTGFKFTTGGRIYSNCGTDWGGTTLMNCFASPRDINDLDSLNGIMANLQMQANTLKSEGGWGDNFSYIRPRGSFIKGIGVESPGAVKYMELFDISSDIITAGSGKKSTNPLAKKKIRKGAMMGVMDVWHPDIIEFITAKQTPGRLSKFNVSVNCTDEFMNRVSILKNLDKEEFPEEYAQLNKWQLRFPDTTHSAYKTEWDGDLASWIAKGYSVVVYDTVSTMTLWNLIMESTYNRAEPGVLFLDRANHYDPANYLNRIFTTNPCGEQTLQPGGVCDLGSMNLTQFIIEIGDTVVFDFPKFEAMIPDAVRFLDNINDVSNAPLPEYEDSMRNKRRIGLGVLGWGSLLFMMKIRFGSDAANELRDAIMNCLATTAYKASIDIAAEKGMFKYCQPELHAEGAFVQSLNLDDEYMEKLRTTGIRNSAILSIQPTGNTSIMANVVSGGGEPVFMPEYIRTVIVGVAPDAIVDVCPKWYEGEFFETEMFKFVKEGDEQILRGEHEGTVYKIDSNRGLTKEVLCEDYGVRWLKARGQWDASADWAVTTTELTSADHLVDMTGFARFLDSAMSKTINIPNNFPYEDFQNIYLDGYKSGWIKGLTTYRSGTMTTVLSSKEDSSTIDEEIILDEVKLPDSAKAVMKTIRAEGKKWYLTVVYKESENRPFAMFVQTNNREPSDITGECVQKLVDLALTKGLPKDHIDLVMSKIKSDSNVQKVARLISFLLRHGVLIKNITLTLDKVEDAFVGSFIFQIKKYLQSYIKDGEPAGEACDHCGGTNVVYSEGCFKCNDCGTSKCG